MTTALIGHEKRWAALACAFARGRVPQTLLVSGPSHIGKSTLARRYAQLLLCPNARSGNAENANGEEASGAESGLPAPCGACRVCHQVEIETFPDYGVMRPIVAAAKDPRDWLVASPSLAGSVITVEMARRFGDEALRKPLAGERKVMVIEQAERMNGEAQNALLKTFEEPARGLTIVLLCDNPDELLPTVRSRCWHVPLGLASDAAIARWLRREFASAPPALVSQAAGAGGGTARRRLARVLRRLLRVEENRGEAPEKAGETAVPRLTQAARIVERIGHTQPVGALGLTEEALRLARLWWAEDHAGESAADSRRSDAKILRSAIARFLDELANAYRARWVEDAQQHARQMEYAADGASPGATTDGAAQDGALRAWEAGLDQIRKTRHYVLRNANSALALDVMFSRLLALRQTQHTR